MICIYSQNNTDYTKNGDAVLIPTRCEVSMTINGTWQLTMEHPYDPEERYKYIVEGAVVRCDIKCIRELPTVQQRFRIYTYTKGLKGITAIGFPVAMESNYDAPIDNLVISNKTGAQAMAALQAFTNKYTLSTDITKTASMSMSNTNVNSAIASAIASGDDNCFISAWGGEILYSNYDYMVKNRLGDNTAADHRIIYGRNLTNIEYMMDDSGLTTRIYPISNDGIRLNGTGYVDSPIASDYPVIHHRFMKAPYTLVDTNASSASETAQKTRQALAAVSSQTTTLSQAVDRTGYPPEYIKQNRNDIVSAVQTMALTGVISTSLYNALSKTIADAMAWMNDLAQPEWDWMGSYEEGWKYGNADGYAVNQYIKIGKKWCYFGANGNWQEPADSSNDWSWYQSTEEAGKRYGDFSRYYAHNEYVFITLDGQLKQYWFDKEGWYDEDKSGDSSYAWNGSGTAEDPWWFGESSSKYLKSCWAFIDGTYYFFDEYGYYDGSTKFADWQWDWVDDGANPWFGNPDETFAAIYITNQWCKIDGEWYYFDQDGYAYDTNAARTDVITLFTTGMASLATTVSTWSGELYTLLYSLMTSYAESKFAQGVDKPVITITVNMADLSKTTEYAGYENLETVKLGDSVECIDNEHNISTTNRVVGITYDVLRDYNAEVTIGNATASVASIVGNAGGEAVAGGFDTSAIEAQINALQNKVGDIYMNGVSIVSNGVGRFAIQPGSNISISRSGNILTISGEGGGGSNIYYGSDAPAANLGVERDLYCRIASGYQTIAKEKYSIWNEVSKTGDSGGYDIVIGGTPGTSANEYIAYKIDGLVKGRKYQFNFKAQFSSGTTFYTGYIDGQGNPVAQSTVGAVFKSFVGEPDYVYVKGLPSDYNAEENYQSFYRDTSEHEYTNSFIADKETMYLLFEFNGVTDGTYRTLTISDFSIYGIGFIEIYEKTNQGWLKYEGGGESYDDFIGTDGTADGSQGLVPKPLTTDAGKILGANGQWIDKGARILSGTSEPTSQDGSNGDLYIETISASSQYRELWTGSISTNAWREPKLIPNVNPSLYSSLKLYGKYNGNVNYEINENNYDSFEAGTTYGYTDIYFYIIPNTDNRYWIGVSDNRTKLTLWVATGYTAQLTKVEGVLLNAISYIKDIFLKENGLWTGEIGEIYSDEEQLCGIWRDGSLLYKKLVPTGGSVPSGATLVERTAMASTGYDNIKYTKTS